MTAKTHVHQSYSLVVSLALCALFSVACGATDLVSSAKTGSSRPSSTIKPSVSRNGTCADASLQLDHALLYADSTQRWSLITELTNRNAERVQAALICITIRNPGSDTPIYEEWFAGTSLLGYETVPVRLLLQTTGIRSDAEVSVFARPDQSPAGQSGKQSSQTTSDHAHNFSVNYVTLHGEPPGPFTVHGELRNTSTLAANNVHLVFALRGDDGSLVGVADAQVTGLEPLLAGDSIAFTATSNLVLAPVARYTWIAEGDIAAP